MKGDKKVIEALNDILTAELTGVNQYFVHHKMCENWGFARLSQQIRAESMSEMRHADSLIERILFLDGVPNVQRLSKVRIGETVPEQLRLDLDLELDAVRRLNQAIAVAREAGDNGSRELFQQILAEEETHVDWLEAQLNLLEQLGTKTYLGQQIGSGGG